MPTEPALPPGESTTPINSLLSSSCSTTCNSHSMDVTSCDHIIHFNGSSYTVNMDMSPTGAHNPCTIQ